MNIQWIPNNVKRQRITAMDSLRGLAAFSVLVFHWNGILAANSSWVLAKIGHLGVDMFFVLSGFLVSLSFLFTKQLKNYFKKRLARIVPLAYSSLIIILVLKMTTGVVIFDWASIKDFLIHLSFTQSFFVSHYYGNFPVMWTLSIELTFYLMVPVLFFLGRKNLKVFLGLLLVLLVSNFAYRYHLIGFFDQWDIHQRIFYSEQIWGRFDQFTYGILLSLAFLYKEQLKIMAKLKYLLVLLGMLLLSWSGWQFYLLESSFRDFAFLQVFLHSIFGFGFALILWGLVYISDKHGYKRIPFLDYLGEISYGVYVWHFFVLSSVATLNLDPYLSLGLAICITIIVASLSWFIIEKPALNFTKRKLANKTN